MGLLVHNPAGELMGVLGGVGAELFDHLGRLLDGFPIGVHGFDDVVVIVDSAGDLAVGRELRSGEKGETSESCKECFFHNESNMRVPRDRCKRRFHFLVLFLGGISLPLGMVRWLLCVVILSGMSDLQGKEWSEREAGRYAKLALAGIDREFPNKPGHVWRSEADHRSPRYWHPVFYGHFDWHSSVHGHWTLVRLLKRYPEAEWSGQVREVLEGRLTREGLQTEAAYLEAHKSFERMYGWAWTLRLALELRTWDDEQGRKWARYLEPLEKVVVTHAKAYLPKLEWPIRCGFHPETAFPLAQFLDYARGVEDGAFAELVVRKAKEYYAGDVHYPVAYEPSGNDFFSPGLNEADLMRRVLSKDEFSNWLEGFFPDLKEGRLGNLLTPVSVSDLDDGHLVHLVGLNLTRAWTMRSIAEALPEHDRRRKILQEAATQHATKGLAQVWSGSYEGEHWLGSFAVYLETEVGR